MNNYDFPVELRPVFTLGEPNGSGEMTMKEVPGKVAVVRNDTNAALGIASKGYKILTHKEALDGFRKSCEGNAVVENITTTRNGALLVAKFTFPEVKVDIGRNGEHDEVAMQVIVKNSYDGTNALSVMLGAWRLICSNGMVIGKTFFSFKQRHFGEAAQSNLQEVQHKIGFFIDRFQQVEGKIMKMMAATYGDRLAREELMGELFNPEKITLPQYLLKCAEEEYRRAKDFSVWGYLNSLTFAISHGMKKEAPQAQLEYGKVAWTAALKQL